MTFTRSGKVDWLGVLVDIALAQVVLRLESDVEGRVSGVHRVDCICRARSGVGLHQAFCPRFRSLGLDVPLLNRIAHDLIFP